MAKKKDNTVEAAAEGQQPSADQLQAKLAKLEAENASLKKAAPQLLPSFEVDDDADNDIEGGTYQFTAPALTWEDNSVIDVRVLAASVEEKHQALYEEICAKLVQIKSGLLKKVT
jgi:hypothetical protein